MSEIETALAPSKSYKEPFTVLYNSMLQHPTMSLESLGVIVFLCSKSPTCSWFVYESYLQKRFRIGRDKIKKIISELCKLGYMKRVILRDSKQKITGRKLIYSKVPEFLKVNLGHLTEDHENHLTENQADGNHLTEKQHLEKKDDLDHYCLDKKRKSDHSPPGDQKIKQPSIQQTTKDLMIPASAGPDKRTSIEDKITDDFEEWWKLYPRKEAKKAAREAYLKARARVAQGVLIESLQAQILDRKIMQKSGREPPFMPHGSTWLNNDRWEDEVRSINQSLQDNLDPVVKDHMRLEAARLRRLERQAQRQKEKDV